MKIAEEGDRNLGFIIFARNTNKRKAQQNNTAGKRFSITKEKRKKKGANTSLNFELLLCIV